MPYVLFLVADQWASDRVAKLKQGRKCERQLIHQLFGVLITSAFLLGLLNEHTSMFS